MKNKRNLSDKNSRYEIRIAGSGGQGIVVAGIILAEAAILDGRYAAQSQSYGPSVRGGPSISEIILSDMEIDYPRVLELDTLVALTQEACDRHLLDLKTDGLVIVDSDLVQRVVWEKVVSLPFQRIAQGVGEKRAINMAALGAVVAFCPSASRSSLATVMARRLPSAKVVNLMAFEEALKLAHNLRGSLKFVDARDEFEI
jgi:2-oxoglutarate ferredoxin oxidoreductase subunit gamma